MAVDEFAREVVLRTGIPEDVTAALPSVSLAFNAGSSRRGDLTAPRRGCARPPQPNAARSTPPRRLPTHGVFDDLERQMLIGGDHLLAHISSTR
jgi:hypothetical protein